MKWDTAQKHTDIRSCKAFRRESEGSHWGRESIYDNESLDKHTMFLESKWTRLISFSWPLLKLEPQIYAGCLGFMALCYYCTLGLHREREGERRRIQGDTPRRDDSQLPALQAYSKTGRPTNTSSHTVLSPRVQRGRDVLTLQAP